MYKRRLILLFIALLFVGLVVLQHFSPKPIDWSLDFKASEKSPYGCFVLHDMLPAIYANHDIRTNHVSFYEGIRDMDGQAKTILIITQSFDPDEYDMESLLDFVYRGNSAFISAFNFKDSFADTLGFSINVPLFDTAAFRKGEERLNFTHYQIRKDSGYFFQRKMPHSRFSEIDSANTQILGEFQPKHINFIKVKFGEGEIYLHSQPVAFTNYHILYGNSDYAGIALNLLPKQPLIWDSYYKPGKIRNSSPMRYILREPALRSAYYLALIAIVIYLIFEGKRRQRKIPVIRPPENNSLQFIQTVGQLYFKNKHHADLAKKKIMYFKEFIREKYFIKSLENVPEVVQKLVAKSGIELNEVEALLQSVDRVQRAERIDANQLIHINQKIEDFYSKCI